MDKLDPDAFAETGDDEYDKLHKTQPITWDMLYEYVISENELPLSQSAGAFAQWLIFEWYEFTDPGREVPLTNRDVINGALADWCGGRTK